MEFVVVTVCDHTHRIAKPVADTLGLRDGSETNDETILNRIIELNWQLIRARQDVIDSAMRRLRS